MTTANVAFVLLWGIYCVCVSIENSYDEIITGLGDGSARLRRRWTKLCVRNSNDTDTSLVWRRRLWFARWLCPWCRIGRLVDSGEKFIVAVLKGTAKICIQNIGAGHSRRGSRNCGVNRTVFDDIWVIDISCNARPTEESVAHRTRNGYINNFLWLTIELPKNARCKRCRFWLVKEIGRKIWSPVEWIYTLSACNVTRKLLLWWFVLDYY